MFEVWPNFQVTVLEARDRVGGRVWDESSMGMSVGHGAMIVIGCINNPVTLLCEQVGHPSCSTPGYKNCVNNIRNI